MVSYCDLASFPPLSLSHIVLAVSFPRELTPLSPLLLLMIRLNMVRGGICCSSGDCLFCGLPKREFDKYDPSPPMSTPRTHDDILFDFIPPERIIICSLHAFLRVGERLLSLFCDYLLSEAGLSSKTLAVRLAFLDKHVGPDLNASKQGDASPDRFKFIEKDGQYESSPKLTGVRLFAFFSRLSFIRLPLLSPLPIPPQDARSPLRKKTKKTKDTSATDPATIRLHEITDTEEQNDVKGRKAEYLESVLASFMLIFNIVCSRYPFYRGLSMKDFTTRDAKYTRLVCEDLTIPVNKDSFTALVQNFLALATTASATLQTAPLCKTNRLSTLYIHILVAHIPHMLEHFGDIHSSNTER